MIFYKLQVYEMKLTSLPCHSLNVLGDPREQISKAENRKKFLLKKVLYWGTSSLRSFSIIWSVNKTMYRDFFFTCWWIFYNPIHSYDLNHHTLSIVSLSISSFPGNTVKNYEKYQRRTETTKKMQRMWKQNAWQYQWENLSCGHHDGKDDRTKFFNCVEDEQLAGSRCDG